MQTRLRLWHRWERQVRAIWPTVRVTQTRVLAYFVFGLVLTGEIALQRVATAWPVAARDPSRERRLRRWLANPRIDPGRLWQQALPILLATLGPTPLFVFDPTPHRADWTRLELGVVVHKRVLPVAWRLVPQQRDWPQRLPALVGPMLAAVQAALPPGCTPTLLVDRGLTSPTLLDQGRALGWHVVMRLKTGPWGAHRVRLGDDETRVWSLVRRPGQRWTGAVALFKDAGWRPVQLTIYWEHGYDAPWLLVSDDLVGSAAVRAFRRRAQVEAAYEDGKSRGWQVERSKITDPARLDRLLLVVALATWWCHHLGLRVLRTGLRPRYDRHDRRDLGIQRLGRRYLLDLLTRDRCPPLLFSVRGGHWHVSGLAR